MNHIRPKVGLKIEITTQSLYNKNLIIYKDYGTGIAEDHIDRIFDIFYTQGDKGTGIGLAFCKNALNSINAHISCQSEHGTYTEFTLTFPRA